MFVVGWTVVVLLQMLWLFPQSCIYPCHWKVPVEVLIVAGLGLMDADPVIEVVVVFYQTIY